MADRLEDVNNDPRLEVTSSGVSTRKKPDPPLLKATINARAAAVAPILRARALSRGLTLVLSDGWNSGAREDWAAFSAEDTNSSGLGWIGRESERCSRSVGAKVRAWSGSERVVKGGLIMIGHLSVQEARRLASVLGTK